MIIAEDTEDTIDSIPKVHFCGRKINIVNLE